MSQLSKQVITSILEKNQSKKFLQSIEIEVYPEIRSTNLHLLQQGYQGKIRVCIADSQTEGRGRHGRQWHSPESKNIYCSFSHHLKIELSELSGLSIVVGISLAETLQEYCKSLIEVKWPNDLLVDSKKLSGILIELKNISGKNEQEFCKVVTGIGVNVESMDADSKIDQPYISLAECHPNQELSRNEICSNMIINILNDIDIFLNAGLSHFQQRWNKHDAWFGKMVELEIGNRIVTGLHRGIDEYGALILDIDGEETVWNSGEVRLRKVSE